MKMVAMVPRDEVTVEFYLRTKISKKEEKYLYPIEFFGLTPTERFRSSCLKFIESNCCFSIGLVRARDPRLRTISVRAQEFCDTARS